MPGYKFLNNNEVLNKKNLKEKINKLYEISNMKVSNNDTKIKQKYDEELIKSAKDNLDQFIFTTKRKLNNDVATEFANKNGLDNKKLRQNHIDYIKLVLTKKAIKKDEVYKHEIAFLSNPKETDKYSLEEIAKRIQPLVIDNYKSYITSNIASSLISDFIKRNFDDFLDLIEANVSDEDLKVLGEEINRDINKNNFIIEGDITNHKYNNASRDAINTLKESKMVGRRQLKDEDIKEYEDSLNYTNELLGDPNNDFARIKSTKETYDNIILGELNNDIDSRLNEMNIETNIISLDESNPLMPYYKINQGKEAAYDNARNKIEFKFSNESKRNIKQTLYRMSTLGFNNTGLNAQRKNNIFGLKTLYDQIDRFNINYNGERIEDTDEAADQNVNMQTRRRIRIATLSKDIKDADLKTGQVINFIKNRFPVNDIDNLSYNPNLNIIDNESIPVKYRMDYPAISALQTLSIIGNIIYENNLEVDDFVENPLENLRKLYDEKISNELDPIKLSETKGGSDLIFSLSRNALSSELEGIDKTVDTALAGLALLDYDKNNRLNNYAKYKAFMDYVKKPYDIMRKINSQIAKNKNLDKLLINPKLKITDIGIKGYDPKTLKVIESNENTFDDVAYLKLRTENIKDFKNRIDREILNYISKEAELVKETKMHDATSLDINKYLNVVQKAVAKYLVVNNDLKETQEYKDLTTFLRYKSNYVNGLIDKIQENQEYREYNAAVELKLTHVVLDNGKNYNTNDIDNNNPYHSVVTSFNSFKNEHHRYDLEKMANNLENDKNQILEIKNVYNSYILAKTAYENEVKKIYGANYHGTINNLSNDKIRNAYIKQNDLLRKYNELKSENIKSLEELYKTGKIPLTYLNDRQINFDHNRFDDIPLFRSQNQFTLDEFINFKYPNEEIADDVKELLFNNYKAQVNREENDFFSRRFLRYENMIDNIDVLEELPVKTQLYSELDEEAEDIYFSGHDVDDVENYDPIEYILDDNRTLSEFKTDFDEKLTDYIKEYYNAYKNDRQSLKEKPAFFDLVNAAQRVALKYVLLKENDGSENYKELYNFVFDGKNYIDKLIQRENARISSENHDLLMQKHEAARERVVGNDEFQANSLIGFKANNFISDDSLINKDANSLIEFDKYLANSIKNNKIPLEVKEKEDEINRMLKPLFDRYKELKQKDEDQYYRENDLNNPKYSDEENLLNKIGNALDNSIHVDYKEEIDNLKKQIDDKISLAKEKINKYYYDGLISNDYVKERYNRIDSFDLSLPKSNYEIDFKLSMNDYIKNKYPNNYKDLSNADKTAIYDIYTKKCIEQRRNYIAINFLEEKEIARDFKRDSAAYKKYISDLEVPLVASKSNIIDNRKLIDEIDDFTTKLKEDLIDKDILDEENIDDNEIIIKNNNMGKII